MKIKKRRTESQDGFPLPLHGLHEEGSTCPIRSHQQKKVEEAAGMLAGKYGARFRMTRRDFLRTSSGMAVCFMAMNSVFGRLFSVDQAEASDPGFAEGRSKSLTTQFIFDVQTHFVSPRYPSRSLLGLRELAKQWNPELRGQKQDLDRIRFDNYYREILRTERYETGASYERSP